MRSDKGLRSTPILRILDSCVCSILLYGIEFWGSDPLLVQKSDTFMYGAIRNIFDLSIATPHRAISSDFSIMPTAIRFQHITRRIAARHLSHRPLDWLDSHLAAGALQAVIRSSLSFVLEDPLLPWFHVVSEVDLVSIFFF